MANQWGADVPVSMPQPLRADQEGIVAMGGFVMTVDGLFPDMSAADHERLSTPSYAPYNPHQPTEETVPDAEEG
ncbi:hypothetical protein AB0E08_07895 [Streptomyces sp. NPDC048281]|uniref:hypothetical protein n=1 Tax=Streptomyces sp. NPDC048281 TaxID=3154715 RepID=UPI00341F332A